MTPVTRHQPYDLRRCPLLTFLPLYGMEEVLTINCRGYGLWRAAIASWAGFMSYPDVGGLTAEQWTAERR